MVLPILAPLLQVRSENAPKRGVGTWSSICVGRMSSESSIYSPYKLQLLIHGAEKLPIADFTTSDPFITILIGGRLEGRTKTVYRNCNPTWGETFNLKLLHRRSVVILKIFDEDKGKDDDLLGSVIVDLAEIGLDQLVQNKYPVIGYGTYDTSQSKVDVSVLIKSTDTVIQVVPDEGVSALEEENISSKTPLSPNSTVSSDTVTNVIERIIDGPTKIVTEESTINALTRFITPDKVGFFPEDLLRDLLLDAHSLIRPQPEALAFARSLPRTIFNRTALRLINSSKIVMATKACFWYPPLPKNTVQLSLCANDSKFLGIEFRNRLSMWVFVRWVMVLYEYWHGRIKSAKLPEWCMSKSFSTHATVHLSDGRSYAGRMTLVRERPYELRVGDDKLLFDNLHNVIVSADTLRPKTDIVDVEVVSYSATGEDEEALAREAAERKSVFQTVRAGIRGTIKGVATGAVTVVSTVSDAAVHTATGVATNAVGAARTIASGKPAHIFHAAQDNLFAVGKDIRAIVKDATSALGGEATTYVAAKFDNISQRVHQAEHFYLDCNPDSFTAKSLGTLRRSSFGQMPSQPSTHQEDLAVAVYPDVERSSSSVSLYLCHGNDNAQMVIGHKRVSAGWLKDRVGQNTELRLDTQVGYSITLINSRGLQLTPPGKMKIGAGGMHVKIKFTDKHGNSKSLGRLQELKTPSITPTPNPDWKDCSIMFKAQDGFENAAFVRVEICLDDFTTNFIVGTCFVPLALFHKKSKEITLPMTRFKLNAVNAQPDEVLHCLGETTMRIYRVEEGSGSPAIVRFRVSHFESNIFNTRWYAECAPAGAVNTDGLRAVEAFSVYPSQEGLEMVSFGQIGAIHGEDGNDDSKDALTQRDKNGKDASRDRDEDRESGSMRESPSERMGRSASRDSLNEGWGQGSPIPDKDTFLIELYENQRRQPYYPFEWSKRAYTRPPYSDEFMNVAYKFEDTDKAVPPPGCSWASPWCLDTKYTDTDENGWIYGIAFRRILADRKAGRPSYTKAQNMMARRRKWVRKVVSNDHSSLAGRNIMQEFQQANQSATSGSTKLDGVASVSLDSQSTHSAGVKGEPTTPHTPSKPVLDSKITQWRNDFLHNFPNALVCVCQERPTLQSNVLIPWDQVKDACIITPSILSLYITVHRYMNGHNGGSFRPADVEVFVSNCPAAELKSMIDERKWFWAFKGKIRNLAASGTINGVVEETDGDDRNSETEDYVPDTEELSLGSELVADLDQNSILLERQVRRIDELLGQRNVEIDRGALREKAVLLRRDCRLRVYMAALFGIGLKGNHNFQDEEVRAIMMRDFKISRNIKQETEVATANNRIEFYLDTAEKRIRDAVLCGWKYRGGRLERCLEIFANGYFVEIVGLLGMFFEDTGIDQVKGLGSKVDLIMTYMKHNDRLATILDHALRPYALRAQPAATLSLFLDFNILVSWYTSVLLLEMRERVNDVLSVWKDRSKDVTGLASEYKFPIPWVPQRSDRSEAQFFTAIPEDLVEVLLTYLQYARIHKDTVAPSFVASVGRLDAEVLMAYTSSFLYLSEQLQGAVNSRDWASATVEEELSEYAIWLSSVTNDVRRVETERLHAPHRVADAGASEGEAFDRGTQEDVKKEELLERQALKTFRRIGFTALDHLCCIVFVYVFHEKRHLLTDDLYRAWLDTLPEEHPAEGKGAPDPIVPSLMDDLSFFLQDKASFLNAHSYHQLVAFAADKAYILYLSLFKIAHRFGGEFGPREIKQIRADIVSITQALHTAMAASPDATQEYALHQRNLANLFVPLQLCCGLLEHDLASVAFDDTMKKLQAHAEAHPHDAAALASLIETFLGLKGVSKYATRKRATPRKSDVSGVPTSASNNVPSSAPSVSTGATVPLHPPTPPNQVPAAGATQTGSGPQAKRRTSMFNFFSHGAGNEGHPSAPAAAPAALAAPAPPASSAHATHQTEAAHKSAARTEELDLDDEDVAEMQRAKELRLKALVDCIGLAIQMVRGHSKVNPKRHVTLTRSSPIERVFGTDRFSEYPLVVQILHSANPPSNATSIAAPTTTYFGAIRGLFSKSTSNSKSRQMRRQYTPGTPTTPHAEDVGESLGYLAITAMKVEDLFYLDTLRSPHPYLKIKFGNFCFTTKVLVADTSADWGGEEPVYVPLRGVGTSESAKSSIAHLEISLFYKGLFTDQVIGSVMVEFAPYAPPLFTDKRFHITDFKSSQAVLAAKRAKEEGRSRPSVILSIAPANSIASSAAQVGTSADGSPRLASHSNEQDQENDND